MQQGRIPDHTRALGKSQGYQTLFVKDYVTDEGIPFMQSAWIPSPDELARLNAGASIILSVVGTTHPPVWVGIGNVPD